MSFKILLGTVCVIPSAELCVSFWSRLRGFMFQRGPSLKALVFQKVAMIHMFFVFVPLAIIVCDTHKKVIDSFVILPWRVSKYYPDAEYLIETTDERVLQLVRPGDILTF